MRYLIIGLLIVVISLQYSTLKNVNFAVKHNVKLSSSMVIVGLSDEAIKRINKEY